MKVIKDPKIASDLRSGTSYITDIRGMYYRDLVEVLGEPTFQSPSPDHKVQKEWVINHKGNIITIYDWKTYDEYRTVNELTKWNVGGKSHSSVVEFINKLMKSPEELLV